MKPKGRALLGRGRGRWDHGAVSEIVIPRWRGRSWVRRADPFSYMRDRGLPMMLAEHVARAALAPVPS